MDNHIGRGAQQLRKRANELTGGQVTIRLFPNAGLGSEQQALEGMQAGTVDMGYITVYTNAVKLGVVLDLPFLFRDFAHWKKAVDGNAGRTIAEAAPAAGVRVLAWHIGGWRDVYGSKPLRTVDDFKGLKLRTQQAVAIVEFFKAIGAIPTPVAWPETYLALQQRTVDAAETALWAMFDAKQYEVEVRGRDPSRPEQHPVPGVGAEVEVAGPRCPAGHPDRRPGGSGYPAQGVPGRCGWDRREAQGKASSSRPRSRPRSATSPSGRFTRSWSPTPRRRRSWTRSRSSDDRYLRA